jgi:hypothetical protein
MAIDNNLLYCATAKEILVFNKNFELIDRFSHKLINGTHEICCNNNKLYVISNQYDAILVYDLHNKSWIQGFKYDIKEGKLLVFDPNSMELTPSDYLHLDMVYVENNNLYFGGSQFRYLTQINLQNYNMTFSPIFHVSKFNGTHNLQRWNSGLIYCLSDENEICFQRNGELEKTWKMPSTLGAFQPVRGCFSKQGYTRGMVVCKDYIICGSSPAKVAMFDLNHNDPLMVIEIEKDIRHSICGMTKYEE